MTFPYSQIRKGQMLTRSTFLPSRPGMSVRTPRIGILSSWILFTYLFLFTEKAEKQREIICPLNNSLNTCSRWDQATWHPGAQSSVWVSGLVDRASTPWSASIASRDTLAGSWNWKRSGDSNPSTLINHDSIPHSTFVAVPVAHLWILSTCFDLLIVLCLSWVVHAIYKCLNYHLEKLFVFLPYFHNWSGWNSANSPDSVVIIIQSKWR